MFGKINIFLLPILGLIIGTVLAVTISTTKLMISLTPYSNLEDQANLIDKITSSNNLLETRISVLEKEHEVLSSLVINPVDRENLENLKSKLALTALEGEGVTLKISFTKEVGIASDRGPVCLSAHLRDLKNTLSIANLGVKGFSINGNRIALRSSINCIGSGVIIDFQRLIPPFTIDIIGDQEKLINIIHTKKHLPLFWQDIDNGLLDIEISKKSPLKIPAYLGNMHTNYITPYVEN